MTHKQEFNKRYGFHKDQSHSRAELSKITKIPLKILNRVFKRGIGAYNTNPSSVRPHIVSPEEWANSRVYAFINKLQKGVLDFDLDLIS
jgi:hypothetical protein